MTSEFETQKKTMICNSFNFGLSGSLWKEHINDFFSITHVQQAVYLQENNENCYTVKSIVFCCNFGVGCKDILMF